jgi:nucleotide-binding universal stress UspA family protein
VEKYDFLRKIIRQNNTSIKVLILASADYDLEKSTLRKLAKELKTKVMEDEIKISGSLKSGGNMPKAVLKMSKSVGADMIVITLKNEAAFNQFFIGPFEQYIVNHATVPVLSVRPKLASSDSQVIKQQIHESLPSQISEFA